MLPEEILKAYYKPSSEDVEIIDAPDFTFVMADGEGDPNKVDDFSTHNRDSLFLLIHTEIPEEKDSSGLQSNAA